MQDLLSFTFIYFHFIYFSYCQQLKWPHSSLSLHMREQYILQPTKCSTGTRNPDPQRQGMVVWTRDTQAADSVFISV